MAKVKEKKVATEVVKEVKVKVEPDKEKWCMSVRLSILSQFVAEMRTLDSVTHEQIEQLITKYGI